MSPLAWMRGSLRSRWSRTGRRSSAVSRFQRPNPSLRLTSPCPSGSFSIVHAVEVLERLAHAPNENRIELRALQGRDILLCEIGGAGGVLDQRRVRDFAV